MSTADIAVAAVIGETAAFLGVIAAGTYLGHQVISRLAAPKQATAGGRNGTRTTTTAVTETAVKPPLAPVGDAPEGNAA